MAVYTSDLTHIEDGNDDRVAETLINFDKMRMIARVWRDMSRFQNPRRSFCFEPIPAIQQWFASLPPIDDNELYALSLAVEPRVNAAISENRPRTNSLSRLFGGNKN